MLKWIKRHKRKIFASLACLTLMIVFALPCFAYDVSVDDGSPYYSYNNEYVTFTSYAYDYINDVSQSYNPPYNSIGITDISVGDMTLKSGRFQSNVTSLSVSEALSAQYATGSTWFNIAATKGTNDELGIRLTTQFSPFYLIWNYRMQIAEYGTTPFKLRVDCDPNANLSVNTDIIIEVSPFGGEDMKKITFEDVDSWEISYRDILNNIPDDWELSVPLESFGEQYALYIHKIEFVTEVYSNVDDLSISGYGVYHRFEYGKYNNHTLCDGNERYADLHAKVAPPHQPLIEVINGYVYVDGVNTGIEAVSFEEIDWLQFTLEWLSNAVDGFLKIEFVPYVTLGTLLIIIVSFSVVMWWLKVFGGG